jgi:hypothetical protein
MKSTGEPAFEIPGRVLHREVDGQMVLLDLASEEYFGLNEVGADIVSRVTRQPYDEAIAALTADYEVDPDTLHRDVRELVDSLVGAGLLERVRGG